MERGRLDTKITERMEKKVSVCVCDVGLCGGTNGVPRLTIRTSPTLPFRGVFLWAVSFSSHHPLFFHFSGFTQCFKNWTDD